MTFELNPNISSIERIISSIQEKDSVNPTQILLSDEKIQDKFIEWLYHNPSWVQTNKSTLGQVFISLPINSDENAKKIQSIFKEKTQKDNTNHDGWIKSIKIAARQNKPEVIKILLRTCRTQKEKEQLSQLKNILKTTLKTDFRNLNLGKGSTFEVTKSLIENWPVDQRATLFNTKYPLLMLMKKKFQDSYRFNEALKFMFTMFPNEKSIFAGYYGTTPLNFCEDEKSLRTVLENCPKQFLGELFKNESGSIFFNRKWMDEPELVKTLLEFYPNKESSYTDKNGKTLLQHGIEHRRLPFLEMLIKEFPNEVLNDINEEIAKRLVKLLKDTGYSSDLKPGLIEMFQKKSINPSIYEFEDPLPIDTTALKGVAYDIIEPKYRVLNFIAESEIEQLRKQHPFANGLTTWEKYINRGVWDKSRIYQNTGSQQPFGLLMHQAVEMAADLKKNKDMTFDQFLSFCTYLRYEIANAIGQPNARKVGLFLKPYKNPIVTQFKGPYKPLKSELQNRGNKIQGRIGKKILTLSTWKYNDTIFHTDTKLVPKILLHVETLYHELLRENDPNKIMVLSGRIMWWICQAKPWHLGDPSIAEIFLRSIWDTKGIDHYPWRSGVIPWVEIMKADDEYNFALDFIQLFDKEYIQSSEVDYLEYLDTLERYLKNNKMHSCDKNNSLAKELFTECERFINSNNEEIRIKANRILNNPAV